jgi:hypothetical protein
MPLVPSSRRSPLGEVLQSASAEATADASEKPIRIVKEKTRMSVEIEVVHGTY